MDELAVARTNVINWGYTAKTGTVSFAGQIKAEITPDMSVKLIRQKANEIGQRWIKEMTAALVAQQTLNKTLAKELEADKKTRRHKKGADSDGGKENSGA